MKRMGNNVPDRKVKEYALIGNLGLLLGTILVLINQFLIK